MLGAIIGDIAGSKYEFNNTFDYDFEMFGEARFGIPQDIGWLFPALGGIATTVRSSFRLKSVSNPRSKNVPLTQRVPMKKRKSSFIISN